MFMFIFVKTTGSPLSQSGLFREKGKRINSCKGDYPKINGLI